jgi:hypothetical protein
MLSSSMFFYSFLSCLICFHSSWSVKYALYMQFSNLGSLEQHGFARNRFWTIETDPPPFPTTTSSKTFVDLILKPSEEDIKIWPHG